MEYGIHLKFFVRFYSLCVVLRVFCPCGLVRQAIKCIFNGVRIGVDRVDITNLYWGDAEGVHVTTVINLRGLRFCEPLDIGKLVWFSGGLCPLHCSWWDGAHGIMHASLLGGLAPQDCVLGSAHCVSSDRVRQDSTCKRFHCSGPLPSELGSPGSCLVHWFGTTHSSPPPKQQGSMW